MNARDVSTVRHAIENLRMVMIDHMPPRPAHDAAIYQELVTAICALQRALRADDPDHEGA